MTSTKLAGAALRCGCCGLPFARVQNGCLVVQSSHHGESHVNVIPLDEVRRLLEEKEPETAAR